MGNDLYADNLCIYIVVCRISQLWALIYTLTTYVFDIVVCRISKKWAMIYTLTTSVFTLLFSG